MNVSRILSGVVGNLLNDTSKQRRFVSSLWARVLSFY